MEKNTGNDEQHMERFQEMEDFTRLEIGLSHIERDRYKVELRFWRPNDHVEYAPVSGIAHFALADFLWELSADAYGQRLCEQLFADARVLARFKEAYAVTEDRDTTVRVQLWIDSSASSLHQLHWETLHNPLTNTALLTNERSLFSRLLGSADLRSVSLRAREEVRALIVIANPSNLEHYRLAALDSASELAHAQKSLAMFSTDTLVSDASHVNCVTLTNVIAQLSKDYDILYLVCHGALRDIDGHGQLEPYLWLESENGDADVVSGTEFVSRLRDLSNYPKLIFLASCQSVNQEHEMRLVNNVLLPALGPRLVQMGIPAVVGMQGNISIETMNRFSSAFFGELQHDGQVERAMAVARRSVLMLRRSDWWMPVLFHRLKDGSLWFTDERSKRLVALLADHRYFLNDRLNSFVGRVTELVEIKEHIGQLLRTGGYVTITGQAGQGKSSIIAKLVDEFSKERYAFHFIPINPGPDHQVGLMRNVMAHLILKYALSELYIASESRAALRDYFPKVLSEVVTKGKQEVIFIDGLDQLEEEATGERDLSFLPLNPPPGVVFVLGTRPNDTLRPLELLKPHIAYPLPNLSRGDFDLILQHRQVALSSVLADRFYEAMQHNALFLDLVAKELVEKQSC